MPGFARSGFSPTPASNLSASDEASQLELSLQRQLEDDVARIFDESIYSDLEVVCGKLKILTHSCILKARTSIFYYKLQSILNVDIEQDTFDEIYSFISDAYTECNIKHQEKEIINYLNEQINIVKLVTNEKILNCKKKIEEDYENLTSCGSPYKNALLKTLSTNAHIEATKENSALVSLHEHSLDKELTEKHAASRAFVLLISSQPNINKISFSQQSKPLSLYLSSSHRSKTNKYSNSCDNLKEQLRGFASIQNWSKSDQIVNICSSQSLDNSHTLDSSSTIDKNSYWKGITAYSPDSLFTSDPSSSSDYLLASNTCLSRECLTGGISQLNILDNINKMENAFTSSDSGQENTKLFESFTSNKDVTLTDIISDDVHVYHSVSNLCYDKNNLQNISTSSNKNKCPPSTKEVHGSAKVKEIPKSPQTVKQRQNEDVVLLEPPALSCETEPCVSVLPPKRAEKEICEEFINYESKPFVHNKENSRENSEGTENLNPNLVQKSQLKFKTACLIDKNVPNSIQITKEPENTKTTALPASTQPMPCSTAKLYISSNDSLESNENKDSLKKFDKKDSESLQKDLSPTIFEMSPIEEDSLHLNILENVIRLEETENKSVDIKNNSSTFIVDEDVSFCKTILVSSTPNNSIMSLKMTSCKQYESEESESDANVTHSGTDTKKNAAKHKEYTPMVSGIVPNEEYLRQTNSLSESPVTQRKIKNIPVVSGTYIPSQVDESKYRNSPKPSNAAWVVDIFSSSKTGGEKNISKSSNNMIKKTEDTACENSRNRSKPNLYSRYNQETCRKVGDFVNSDTSEKSNQHFFIDLASLPDPIPLTENIQSKSSSEKNNIFSMYIDLGNKTTVKEKPARLTSSLTKKLACDSKGTSNSIELERNIVTNTSNSVFEKYESLCNDSNISISEIIKNNYFKLSTNTDAVNLKGSVKQKSNKTESFCKNVRPKEPIYDQNIDLFVKLSDLDKLDTNIHEGKVLDVRMTRSDNNWREHSKISRKSIAVITSFHSENALSLNRLFPNLKNELSLSMPETSTGQLLPTQLGTTSPGDLTGQASDISEISSAGSSVCRSVVENSTTEETSQTSNLIDNCQSRLGQDLLRMFLEEIAPDVIVEVSGRRIQAHKCILSSRCQYFAGILSGGWVESSGNVIVMPPFSYNVVHFVMCHIYSGVSTIPDSISIVELATIADMLGLEGLKEAIMFTLKVKYCHNFHRPCRVCTAGVLECFPLSSVYGLDDLYRKCLRWITKYFSIVWPTKAFATLPKELLDKCYEQHIVHLTIDNLIDTVYGCGITVASLQTSRWAEIVARMCQRLMNAVANYVAPRLLAVLRLVVPQWPEVSSPAEQALDECLAAAIEWAPPDETCRAYAFLTALLKEIRTQHTKLDSIPNSAQLKAAGCNNQLYNRVQCWQRQCEDALVEATHRVVSTQSFKDLPPDLKKRLRELGCTMYRNQGVPTSSTSFQDKKTRNSYHKIQSHVSTTTQSLDIDKVCASFVPYSPKPKAPAGSAEVQMRKKIINGVNRPKVKTTKAQEKRAKFNLSKHNQSTERLGNNISVARPTFENPKSRSLEPKYSKDSEKISTASKKLTSKIKSASESPHNSSSVQAYNLRMSCVQGQQATQNSLVRAANNSRPRTAEPSTDSRSESLNKHAIPTKMKQSTNGSMNSVTSSSHQNSTKTNYKLKTKIPVYLNQSFRLGYGDVKNSTQRAQPIRVSSNSVASIPERKKVSERLPGSLMNATQSSSAKMVTKTVKEQIPTKNISKNKIRTANNSSRYEESEHSSNIPVMGRSGTFLKDEPTFGDITANIDIVQ